MKTISSPLRTHLAGEVTTLCACWQVIRTDGQSFAFTTHDADLVISGVTYSSAAGFSASAIATTSTGEVDNLEAAGFLSTLGLEEQDLQNGLFNYATVYVFACNWADTSQGILRLRRGWLGEVARRSDGGFIAELRGLTQALTQEFGNVYTPYCRADLGDNKCQVPIGPGGWTAGAVVDVNAYVRPSPAAQTTDALRTAIFIVSTGGTAGGSEPAWNTTVGATTSDGSVVWTSVQPLRLMGTVLTPIDQHSFVASPLATPGGVVGTTALISVRNNVTAGTVLEINDGVHSPSVSIPWNFETAGVTVAADIVSNIATNHAAGVLDITVTSETGTWNIFLASTSGKQAHIAKTGDAANPPAINIQDFAAGYLDGGTLTWIDGANAGASIEIKTYSGDGSVVYLWLGMASAAVAGDRFWYYPGCDKRRETCRDKFNNILNFRGEPDMPGLDAALAYPDAR